MSSKYIGNSADLGQGIYTVQDVQEKIKTESWPVKYNIENSLRFNGTNSSLTRTPTNFVGTSTKTWTISCWIKLGNTSNFYILDTTAGSAEETLRFDAGLIDYVHYQSSVTQRALSPSYYRDLSQWYHLVAAADTTQSVQSNRMKYFINGQQIINLSFTGFGPNDDLGFNKNELHVIGRRNSYNDRWAQGYLTDFYFIDGQALDPSYFAFTHPVTNKWVPKAYKGTYGTNGFHLEFKNTGTHTGVGGIGEDTSGNGNHWAVSNFTADDVVPDSPTNNFCTINSLHAMPGRTDFATLLDGSLTINTGTTSPSPMFSSFKFPKSGKWYWEIYLGGSYQGIFSGIRDDQEKSGVTYYESTYYSFNSAGSATTIATPNNTAVGAVYGYYVDFDTGIFRAYLNGTPQGDVNILERFGDVLYNRNYHAYFADGASAGSTTQTVNFGQDPTFANNKVPGKVYTDSNGYGKFYYEPPAGALALCEANINQPENTVSEYVVDETANHMLTYNGGVGISKFSPYAPDGYSIAQNFPNSYLNFGGTDWSFPADFTIEAWVYLYTMPTGASIYVSSNGGSYFAFNINSTNYDIYLNTGTVGVGPHLLQLHKWNHVAMVREGSTLSFYTNGVRVGTLTNSSTLGYTNPTLNRNGGGNGNDFLVTDLRIIRGQALYSGTSISIPTSALTTTPETILHISSLNNKFKDSSSNNYSITLTGSPSIIDYTPFIPKPDAGFRRVEDYGGGSSFYFDGNSGYITTPYDSMLNGNVTIEGWYYFSSNKQYQGLWGSGVDFQGINLQYQELVNKKLSLFVGNGGWGISGGGYYSNTLLEVGNWYHIAYMKNNLTHYVFINGVLDSSINGVTATGAHTWSSNTFYIGVPQLISRIMDGYISDFRITNSLLYPTNGDSFTPPALKLTSDVNTELLTQPWHTKPARSSVYEITDSYKNDETGKSLTYVGATNITQSSPYKNINFGSIESSTNNNSYISLENNSDFNFGTGPFTMETWIKRSGDTSSTRMIFNRSDRSGNNMNNNEYAWFITGTEMQVHYPGVVAISGGSDLSNVNNADWMHVVWERVDTNAGGVHFYVNGVKTSSHQYSFNLDSTRNFEIGGASTSGRGVGFYSDIRIVKGQALYGGTNFTPPAYPLSTTHYTTDGTDPVTSSTKQTITGTVALLTQPGKTSTVNIAAKKPEKHFNTLLYSGTGQTQSITGLDFKPDLVWIKKRSSSASHLITDSIIGPNVRLRTDTTGEKQEQFMLSSFDVNGFTLNDLNTATGTAANSVDTFVAWCWKAGGTPSADGVAMVDGVETTTTALKNSAGASITPTRMSVNTKAGFSIVKYVGTGSTGGTVPHGLNNIPDIVIIKNLIDGARSWNVTSFLTTPSTVLTAFTFDIGSKTGGVLGLNYPNGAGSYSIDGQTSGNNQDHIAYCWHSVPGYSAFGSYTGNGSTDGPFVYTGFKPAWVMIKRTDVGDNWLIQDSVRTPFNWTCNMLAANTPNQENTTEAESTYGRDYLSNGFKIRASHVSHNATNGTYIYAAFAEQPFTRTNAR